ncbi:MAG: hypothetical protein MJ201_01450 [Mycoplasmoidaceae bacterium]|nr:hypothetical protein [Mycoplasmoidaceae bacterium]
MNNKFDFDIYTDSIKVIQNEINTVSDVNKLKEMLVFVVEQLENDEHKLKELGHRIDRSSTLNG